MGLIVYGFYEKPDAIRLFLYLKQYTINEVETAKGIKNYVGDKLRAEIFIMSTFPMIPFIKLIFTGSKIEYNISNNFF